MSSDSPAALFDTLEVVIPLKTDSSLGAAINMAVDEVLLVHAKTPILRIYDWARPAVSFGYFEKWKSVKDIYPETAWEHVRRWTGGGVVPHGDDWTYSIIVPRNHPFARLNATESYRILHDLLADSLREMPGSRDNFDVTTASAVKVSQACFENPAQYDLLRDGKKIAGAAQRRSRFGLLHQGSVQGMPVPVGFVDHFALRLAANVLERSLNSHEITEATTLSQTKYATEEWTRKF